MRRLRPLILCVLAGIGLCLGAQQPPSSGSFRIAGTVVNGTTGSPVSRATISILNEDNNQVVASTLSDAEGHFAFTQLPAGKYPLTGSKRGFRTSFYDEHNEFSSAIVTGADQETDHLVLQLTPGAVLTGVITADGGDPVEGASVMLFRRPAAPGERVVQIETTTTDDTGAYEFSDLAQGEYFVAVQAEPWYAVRSRASRTASGERSQLDVAYPLTFFETATDESAATPIALSPGDRQQADVMLHAVPAVHIKVSGAPGQENTPQVGVHQVVFGVPVVSGNLDNAGMPKGSIEVLGLAPGHYQLSHGDPPRSVDLDAASDAEIDSNAGTPAVTLSGTLRVTSGSPIGDLALSLDPVGDARGRSPIQANARSGRFRFEGVTAGAWSINALPTGNGTAPPVVVSLTAGTTAWGGNRVQVGDQPLNLTITLSRSQTTIQGFARKDGKPAVGVMIVLVPRDPNAYSALVRRDQSDSDGSFALHDVAAGEYTVIAIKNGWNLNWRNYRDLARFLPSGVNVNVTEHSGPLLRLSQTVQATEP